MLNKKLQLAIDGNEANVTNRVGSNVYAYELLTSLESLPDVRDSADVTVLLSAAPLPDLPKARAGWQYQVVSPRPFWTQLGLPLYLWFHPRRFDVLFTPGHYAPRWSPIPYISSVMDLAFLEYSDQFKASDLVQLRDWTAYSVAGASKVVAISKATKRAVVAAYGQSAEDVVVAYPALAELVPDLSIKEGIVLEKKLALSEPFLVYVGTVQPRKNLVRLIKAFEIMCDELKTGRSTTIPHLVIAGKVGWLADEILATYQSCSYQDNIHLAGYVTEAEKQYLLRNAAGSVLVGLYEGFGIPALESLRLGTIPVVSNTTSLPEVVGSAGIMVDPESVESIARGLQKVLQLSQREKARLRKLGREQVAMFSWEKTAKVVWKAIKEIQT